MRALARTFCVRVPASLVFLSSDTVWGAYASWVEGPRSCVVNELFQGIVVQRILLETQLEEPQVLSCLTPGRSVSNLGFLREGRWCSEGKDIEDHPVPSFSGLCRRGSPRKETL